MVDRRRVLIIVLIEFVSLGAIGLIIYVMLASASPADAPLRDVPVPDTISYQGRIDVNGTPFEGIGQFKFAIVKHNGLECYWTNDGTGIDTAPFTPTDYVTLTVTDGLFSVMLGRLDMQKITANVFSQTIRLNNLRVWFNDGSNGWQLLEPDTPFSWVPYALLSNWATGANEASIATTALTSTWATTATNAITATWATTATIADLATEANIATYAIQANSSFYANAAGQADTAQYASQADTANYATNAITAQIALTANYSLISTTWATTATYATSALTATSATTVPATAYADNTALGARVSTATIFTMSHGIYYRIPFDTEAFDTNEIHNSTEVTLTCKTPGIYVVSGDVRFSAVTTGTRIIEVLVNGASVARQRSPALSGAVPGLNISTIYQLNLNDAVTLQVYQDSGTTVQMMQADFSMVRVP